MCDADDPYFSLASIDDTKLFINEQGQIVVEYTSRFEDLASKLSLVIMLSVLKAIKPQVNGFSHENSLTKHGLGCIRESCTTAKLQYC